MIIVSYYTDDFYRVYAERLAESVKRAGWPIHVEQLPHRRTHNENVHQKVPFLRRMLEQYAPVPILWIDADAEVVGDLEGVNSLAINHAVEFGSVVYTADGTLREQLAGTLYLKPTANTHLLLDLWEKTNTRHPTRFDQENLDHVLRNHDGGKIVGGVDMSPIYCWLETPMRTYYKTAVPVIRHYGVSRERLMRGK